MGLLLKLVLHVSSRSTREMDQVGANLSKQDPGHPIMASPTETR
jgi:hypothetical protein